jgi:hypothetical protein
MDAKMLMISVRKLYWRSNSNENPVYDNFSVTTHCNDCDLMIYMLSFPMTILFLQAAQSD